MDLKTNKVFIRDGATKRYLLRQGQEVFFVNQDGKDIGSFNVQAQSRTLDQEGTIVLEGVPFSQTTLYFDVNYEHSDRLHVLNDTGDTSSITFKNADLETLLVERNGGEFRAKPFTATWDVEGALEEQDVRVTVSVTPMPEQHGAIISFTTTPLAEARKVDRQVNRNSITKFFREFFRTN